MNHADLADDGGGAFGAADFDAEEPSVAANGPTFLVVWSEGHAARKRIYGTRVNDAGVPLDPDGLVIASDDAVDSSSPSVTRGRGSTWGTTYGTGERPWSIQNLFMRTVAPK